MTSAPRFEDALAHLDAGAVAEAARVLDALAHATPGHATAHVLRAQVAEGLHRWADALAAWRAAAVLLPDAPLVRQGTLRAARVLAVLQPADPAFGVRWGRPEPAAVVEAPAEPAPGELAPVETPSEAAAPDALRSDDAGPEGEDVAVAVDEPETHQADDAGTAAADEQAPSLGPPPAEGDGASPTGDAAGEEPFDAAPPRTDDVPPATWEAPVPPDAEGVDDAPLPTAWGGSTAEAFLTADDPAPAWAPLAETPGPAPTRPVPADLDLDRLIDELNTAGRIVPRTDFDRVPPPELDDDIDDMVSETLARIYAGQGQFAEAARVYEQLAAQQPDRADHFRAEADALRAKGKG